LTKPQPSVKCWTTIIHTKKF